MAEHTVDDEIERALRTLGDRITGRRRRPHVPADFPAFRAAMEERLRAIEREVGEAKQRINAILLVLAGTVISAVAVRLAEVLG